jgi:hypothetical protein
MASREIKVGQQFQRLDSAGLVFEVIEAVTSVKPPHIRVRRVDDPTDMRVFSLSALADRHLFRAVADSSPQAHSGSGQLRLSPT